MGVNLFVVVPKAARETSDDVASTSVTVTEKAGGYVHVGGRGAHRQMYLLSTGAPKKIADHYDQASTS